MNANEIREKYLEFFRSKGHAIVPSAPLVVKDDPTLMFTNAGMNQFKEIFLGNKPASSPRVADTQKCLRVSGKHNDLEEVGVDTYHHTMFEMLGNWSFGDYFKKDAIEWAWELLTKVYKLPEEQLYVTVFEGSEDDKLPFDQEAFDLWKQFLPADRILNGSKKDNFWEMGETGPCGPCTEIHVDLRPANERAATPGQQLVNQNDPRVVEIWNLVFMQFNRMSNGSLQALPAKHVDTGMGFERLCMALQGKTSNYDTDVFSDYIRALEDLSGKKYTQSDTREDIAMRVIADHIRAVAFAIADGQLPSNTGAGYVIRRILRRAVRYGYSFLGFREPFFHLLTTHLANNFEKVFPNLKTQESLVKQVIREEEVSFLRTLEKGIQRFQDYIDREQGEIKGEFAFELYDTYGFPIDLTQLLARENERTVDMKAFQDELEKQKARSRNATKTEEGDWVTVSTGDETIFTGYDAFSNPSKILKYREVKAKGKNSFQLVLDQTPFYAESGGQTGDQGWLIGKTEKIRIYDTRKENNLIVHFAEAVPTDPKETFTAEIDTNRRTLTARNHSATHLLHAALRELLGTHVEQKGSLVTAEYLRFDFSHFSKMSPEDLEKIGEMVNQAIWKGLPLHEERELDIEEAKSRGAMALFGEKYGDKVRVISFGGDYSIELCGGTHVQNTAEIGLFTITAESSVAAGVRRIEAKTSQYAFAELKAFENSIEKLRSLLKNADPEKAVAQLIEQNEKLKKEQQAAGRKLLQEEKEHLLKQAAGAPVVTHLSSLTDGELLKDLAFQFKQEAPETSLVIGAENGEKAYLSVLIPENLVKEKSLDAGKLIRELAREIKGGGGGQAFFATAGGTDKSGLQSALSKALTLLSK